MCNKAEHTPAPWKYCQADKEHGCSCGLIWSIPNDCVVAMTIFKDDDHTKPHEVAVANAKLIAAAPELFLACQTITDTFEGRKGLEFVEQMALDKAIEAIELVVGELHNHSNIFAK